MTERFDLTSDAWTDLGPTPCFLQIERVYPVRFVIATGEPDALDAPAHVLSNGEAASWCDVGLEGQRIYGSGMNTALSGLKPGRVFLSGSAPGAITYTPPEAAGSTYQELGSVTSAGVLMVNLGEPITRG